MKVLAIDVGGSNVKLMASGHDEMRKFPSGRGLTAREMMVGIRNFTRDWDFERVTLGFPGLVKDGRIVREPLNLSGGWKHYNFQRALGKPVRIVNDAALQAIANYRDKRTLFLGFGTSVGAAIIAHNAVISLELGLIKFSRTRQFMTELTKEARRAHGNDRWNEFVHEAVALLSDIFQPEDFVIGGGNAKHVTSVPEGCRITSNREVLRGAERVWEENQTLQW